MGSYCRNLKSSFFIFLNLFLLAFSGNISAQNIAGNRNMLFNENWSFYRGDVKDAASPGFDDSSWRNIDLPHDISMEDLPEQDSLTAGPFFKLIEKGGDVGYLKGGVAWYRKNFVLNREDQRKQVILNFDGIQTEAEIYINGRKIAEHKHGYTPFNVNITSSLLPFGTENIIAVKVVNPSENSRWYPGFGIYRDVTLTLLNPVHIKEWGVYIKTPVIEKNKVIAKIKVQCTNTTGIDEEVEMKLEIFSSEGELVKTDDRKLLVGGKNLVEADFELLITNPKLWNIDNPYLYTARVSLINNKKVLDEYKVNFGIRSIDFSVEEGFKLNGEPLLLKGACIHHDNGLLGAAAFKQAEYRKVEMLKRFGYNAIRTSHNPPSKHFLDACDHFGILVIDEAFDMWEKPKRKNDYHLWFHEYWEKDLQAMLLRDRNHPCIIMWSYGNEIPERARPEGIETAKKLIVKIRSLNSTRPVTQAICRMWDNKDQNWDDHTPAAFEVMDIAGYNYRNDKFESDHKLYPERIICTLESYPKEAFQFWKSVRELPYVIGDFVWTGMDYLGESGIGITKYLKKEQFIKKPLPWPWYNANCGDIDITGNKKPSGIFRRVLWGESTLDMMVHEPIPNGLTEVISRWGWPREYASWNWKGCEKDTLLVNVYSSYPKVQLFLDDKLIGEQEIDKDKGITATFKVPYKKGKLKACGIER